MKDREMRTLILPILGVTLLLGGAGCRRAESSVAATAPAELLEVAPVPATARALPATLDLTGTLLPDQQSEVTPLVAGRVSQVLVERGAIVQEGQPLLKLRNVDFQSAMMASEMALGQARARLGIGEGAAGERFDPEQAPDARAARANRDAAEDSLRRAERLGQSGAISPQELTRLRAQADAAREQYQVTVNGLRGSYMAMRGAQVQLSQSRRSVADSTVRAPFAGEISERKVNVGEFVTTQRAVVTLVRTDPLRLEVQIPQEHIAQVQVGQEVEVRVDAFPGRVFSGKIRYISAAVRVDTRGLVAEAVVPNGDRALRPGLFARAKLRLGKQREVVAVPQSAVLSSAGTHRVFVIQEGRVVERVVSIAERDKDTVLISQGLSPQERVATAKLEQLSDGLRVKG